MKSSKTPINHGVRSPMGGYTPPVKMPNLHPSGGGTIIPNSGKSAPIQSPQNGKANVK